jgi:hypothetical protein
MFTLNPFALGAATVAALVISAAWYGILGDRMVALRGDDAAGQVAAAAPEPWKIGVELLRSLTVATALAAVVAALEVSTVGAGLVIGIAAWVAFPATLLVGSVIWEDVPIGHAAIHAGDWLLKLTVITTVVTLWQ